MLTPGALSTGATGFTSLTAGRHSTVWIVATALGLPPQVMCHPDSGRGLGHAGRSGPVGQASGRRLQTHFEIETHSALSPQDFGSA